ncbi:MAG: hypothetical protein ABEN55_04120 [Bradymonadaceae bacterium]
MNDPIFDDRRAQNVYYEQQGRLLYLDEIPVETNWDVCPSCDNPFHFVDDVHGLEVQNNAGEWTARHPDSEEPYQGDSKSMTGALEKLFDDIDSLPSIYART